MADAAAFIAASAAAQLALLPHFSNIPKDDQYTADQWIKKVETHRRAAGWDEANTITHVQNAFRGTEVLDWFESLEPLGIDVLHWEPIKAAFINDFKAAPTISSVVFKIADIKQQDTET